MDKTISPKNLKAIYTVLSVTQRFTTAQVDAASVAMFGHVTAELTRQEASQLLDSYRA